MTVDVGGPFTAFLSGVGMKDKTLFVGCYEIETMNSKLTVFLCSTFTDLTEERQRVLDAVRKLQLQHDSMEFFGARSDVPIETCLKEVRRSDVLVVIVGHRYGSLVPQLDISFSEAEYQEGHRLGKPCLVYMRDENVPVLPKYVERDPENMHRLERWKSELQTRHTVAPFTDSHDLAVRVAADLATTIQVQEHSEPSPRTAGTAENEELDRILKQAVAAGLSSSTVVSGLRRVIDGLLTESPSKPPSVFLSHSHQDKEIVRPFADLLRTKDVRVWFDEAELRLGDSIVETIQRGLDTADFVAFFISKSSLSSQWPRRELDIAMSRQLSGGSKAILLPVLLDDVEIPSILRNVMYLDLRDRDVGKGVDRLTEAIKYHLAEERRAPLINVSRTNKPGYLRAYVIVALLSVPLQNTVAKILQEHPEVLEVRMLLGEADLLLDVSVPSVAHLQEFVKRISIVEGVRSTATFIQGGTPKRR